MEASCQGHHSCQCVAGALHDSVLHPMGHVCTNRSNFSVDGVYKQLQNRYHNVLVNENQLTSYLPVDKGLSFFQLMGINFHLGELKHLM